MVLVLTYILELMYISELKAFIEQIPKVKLLLCECLLKSQCVGLGYSNFILSLSLSYAYIHTHILAFSFDWPRQFVDGFNN